MLINFKPCSVSVIVCPTDLRCGYSRLCEYAHLVGIDVNAGGHVVVFVSKSRSVCKVICSDQYGTILVSRRLHQGRFEQLMARVEGPASVSLTAAELEKYLQGLPIFEKKDSFW